MWKWHVCARVCVCVHVWMCASKWACEHCRDLRENRPPPALLMPAGQFLLGRQDCISAVEVPPILFLPPSCHHPPLSLALRFSARDFTGCGLEHGTNLSAEWRIWKCNKVYSCMCRILPERINTSLIIQSCLVFHRIVIKRSALACLLAPL